MLFQSDTAFQMRNTVSVGIVSSQAMLTRCSIIGESDCIPRLLSHSLYMVIMPLHTTTRMLAPFLGGLTEEDLDSLPYGVIQLDQDGYVLSANGAECRASGWTESPVGRHYFRDLAPSANTPEFRGRLNYGVSRERLDETFEYTFYSGLTPRRALVRLYLSPQTHTPWVFIAQPNGEPIEALGGRLENDAPFQKEAPALSE